MKYYIAAREAERVGRPRVEVKAGDFHVPVNIWHVTRNPYAAPLRLRCWDQIPGAYCHAPVAFLHR